MIFNRKPAALPSEAEALPGRSEPVPTAAQHFVNGAALDAPLEPGQARIYFGMGCFWGAERLFWQEDGVVRTSVGYQGGHTANPTYREVCSGRTGHTEAVEVVWDERETSLDRMLALFWESHDPTQGMRQGNDVGTQYRSAIYATTPEQLEAALESRDRYSAALAESGRSAEITTEIRMAPPYFFAEADHQQYLAKNPHGYCGIGGTGVSCPLPPAKAGAAAAGA